MKTGIAIAAAVLVVMAAGGTAAQQPGAGPGRSGSAAAFEEFREKHKYTFELLDTVRKIDRIDRDQKYTLSQAQAKQILAVLKPLREQPKLTQTQARQAIAGVKKPLTTAQLNAMSRIQQPERPGRGQGLAAGPNPGTRQRPQGPPPGGPPGDTDKRPAMRGIDPKTMQDFNPFYAKANPNDPRSAERAKRWDEFFNRLEKKANPSKSQAPTTGAKAPATASTGKTTKR